MKRCRVCRSRVSPCGSPSVVPTSPPLLLSLSLFPCAAWVILFQQHPWLPGRGMKPSDTNKTQTKTPDVPCAGPWASTHQTFSLSFSLSFFHSPCVSFSVSSIHTHINSETDTPDTVAIITLALLPEYRAAGRLMDAFFGGFVELRNKFTLRGEAVYYYYFTDMPTTPSDTHIFKVWLQIFKLHSPKYQGINEMRGKLMGNHRLATERP